MNLEEEMTWERIFDMFAHMKEHLEKLCARLAMAPISEPERDQSAFRTTYR